MDNIGSYRVLSNLGAGTFGVVYEAYQPFLDRRVAIKTLRDVLVNDAHLEQSFMAEARTIARLRHPNIVTVYEFGTTQQGGQPITYLVMEYLPGQSLLTRIKNRALTLSQIVDTLTELASALDFAHQNNIIHCDLKPANIIFTENGQPVIVDFGLAKLVEISGAPVEAGSYLESSLNGTPAYAAPERLNGQAATAASDIYSLATIAYEMLAGRLPFPDSDRHRRVEGSRAPAPLLSAVTPQYGTRADAILARALSPNVEDRYQTAKTFARALSYALMPNRTENRVITVVDPQQAAALSDARRSVRGFAWGMVALVAVFSLFCVSLFIRAYADGQPNLLTDGLNTYNERDAEGYRTITAVWPGSSAEAAGVRVGDRILATIDADRNTVSINFRVNGVRRAMYGRNWQPQLGDKITQDIVRGEETLTVTYEIERGAPYIVLLLVMLIPATASFSGAVYTLRRWGDTTSGQFFALILLELTFTLVAMGVVPALPGLFHLAFYLFFALSEHFMLTYPTEARIVRRFPWVIWLPYLPVALGIIQFMFGVSFTVGDLDLNMVAYGLYAAVALFTQISKWAVADAKQFPQIWIMLAGYLLLGVFGGITIYLNIARSSPNRPVENSAYLLVALFATLAAGAAAYTLTMLVGFERMQARLNPKTSP